MERIKEILAVLGVVSSLIAIAVMFVLGAVLGWKMNSVKVDPGPVEIEFLPPTPTSVPCVVEIGGEVWAETVSQPHRYVTRVVTENDLTDFKVGVDVRINDNSPEFHGLIFRAQDNENFYSFRVAQTGEFAFDIWQSGDTNYRRLMGPATSRAVRVGPGEVNRLEVIAEGAEFILFVNGARVASVVDNTFDKGSVGFLVCTCDGADEVDVEFYNLTVNGAGR